MGYNTVVMLLNDHMHELSKAPLTLAWAICHPPHSSLDLEKHWWPQVESVARNNGENISCFRNALAVLPTYHADDKHILVAGWNSLIRPKYEDYKYNKKKNELTVKMPEYWTR
jgi:hypothetical protein